LKRKLSLVVILFLTVLVASGCSAMQPKSLDDLQNGNIFFAYFVYPLASLLEWLHDLLWNEYGLAILCLTIIVRLIVLPLSIKQVKSSKEMQKLQPIMQKLREEHKDDPQRLQQETMKLFQERGVNPLAGCLPLLIQMPILFALFYAINTEGVVSETFLWLQLGKADTTFILPILAAITTSIPMMMMKNTPPQMKIMLYIFPVIIFFTSYTLPSALPLYWFFSNIFTIIQTYFLYRDSEDVAVVSNDTMNAKPEKKEKKKRWK
jgi:YidC/Oxa1 family membrane protein insertase